MDFTALISQLGIDKLPQSQQQAIFEDMFQTLQLRINRRVANILTDEQVDALEAAAIHSEAAALAELQRLCPDYEKMYQEEIDALHKEIVGM